MSLALALERRAWPARAGGARVPRPERKRLYLHPGHLAVCKEPALVTTILGSCVSVCLWDRDARIGGLTHFLLPLGTAHGPEALRFGNVAIDALIDALAGQGAGRHTLRAKVFGGACVTGGGVHSVAGKLGARNVSQAFDVLALREIAVEAEDTGGLRGRKLLFQTDDGAAWVKEL